MALNDYKITGVPETAQTAGNFTLNDMGNRGKPNIPGLSTEDMQDLLDELSTKVLAPAHNGLIDEVSTEIDSINDKYDDIEATGLLDDQRAFVNDVDDAHGPSDVPTVGALIDYVGDMGGGDMSSTAYATGVNPAENEHTVDHALYADNAGELNGHDGTYYATAAGLAAVTEDVESIMDDVSAPAFNDRTFISGYGYNCYAGIITSGGKRLRFSIPLWKTLPSDIAWGLQNGNTKLNVYGPSGLLVDNVDIGDVRTISSVTVASSWNMLNVKVDFAARITNLDSIAVTVYATSNIRKSLG